MAEIIKLRHNDVRNYSTESALEPMESERLKESAGSSSKNEVFLWVRRLEACLEDLEVIANSLAGPSQRYLRGKIKLLRDELLSARIKLNRALQDLPVRVPSLNGCSVEGYSTSINGSN